MAMEMTTLHKLTSLVITALVSPLASWRVAARERLEKERTFEQKEERDQEKSIVF